MQGFQAGMGVDPEAPKHLLSTLPGPPLLSREFTSPLGHQCQPCSPVRLTLVANKLRGMLVTLWAVEGLCCLGLQLQMQHHVHGHPGVPTALLTQSPPHRPFLISAGSMADDHARNWCHFSQVAVLCLLSSLHRQCNKINKIKGIREPNS